MTHLNWVFPSAEESQTTGSGAEEENDNSCEKETEPKGEEESSISAPMVLSQEMMEEVCRRLHSLQKHVKRLQVRGDKQREENLEKNWEQGV